MKIRNGFVSNSSSSSFICEVSGEVESGMDMCIEDAGMLECEKGHIFCEQYKVGEPTAEILYKYCKDELDSRVKETQPSWRTESEHDKYINEIKSLLVRLEENKDDKDAIEELIGEFLDDYPIYAYPKECCPICTKTHIRDSDVLKHLLKKYDLDIEKVKEEIRNEN